MQPPAPVLFAIFLLSLIAAIGFAIYAGGALIGVRTQKLEGFSVPAPPAIPGELPVRVAGRVA